MITCQRGKIRGLDLDATVFICSDRWRKRSWSRRSALVLLCSLCGLCVCTRAHMGLACGYLTMQGTVKENKDSVIIRGWETEGAGKKGFIFSMQVCKSDSHTQHSWNYRRIKRKESAFLKSDIAWQQDIWKTEKQLTITVTRGIRIAQRDCEWIFLRYIW